MWGVIPSSVVKVYVYTLDGALVQEWHSFKAAVSGLILHEALYINILLLGNLTEVIFSVTLLVLPKIIQ